MGTLMALVFLKWFAKAASPQPRSAMRSGDLVFLWREERREMKTSIGFVGQDWT